MLLQPKKSKYKKLKKRYLKNQLLETKSFVLRHGTIGIKVLTAARFTARQIEALRQCVSRSLGRKGKIWINVFPSIPVTAKPTENRMGKGKGSINYWSVPVKAGSILMEIAGVSTMESKLALSKGAAKLPVKTKIVF